MKNKVIQQIEAELSKAKMSDGEMFARHMYAVETLARLAATTADADEKVQYVSHSNPTTSQPVISAAELKMMGAKVPTKENKAVTDDGFGNGDSLFDF
ncbi:hypothetical protein ERX27_05715 [Macrococcus brunensis]|uniref:YwdI family protein n=1 Tax=Macrococcus brunensis TaxID=198483 RepID=A0A4R6BDV2_9STAP|nr:YwdI family protein [Macrococcus brunensis]TDL97957.1 hypothetical protein ERX27_05715 [Macrococcus brunensis]ULG71784.1 YwdI family protein [Macrococcus brunensis]ULG74042.1 YwdI family protein [Macrococcus brunensis]